MTRTAPASLQRVFRLFCIILVFGACADSEPRRVTVIIEQVFGTSFGRMATGVVHSNDEAIIVTRDMRTQPGYTELRPELVCAGLDLANSYVEVVDFEAEASAASIVYRVEIREIGETSWQLLGVLEASVAANASFFLSEEAWTVDGEGLSLLSQIALSDKPQYEVRFEGTAAEQPITALELELTLEVRFANEASDCP